MANFIVNGLRINWAGRKSKGFYQKSVGGPPVAPEPSESHPPEIAATCLDDKNAEEVRQAAVMLIDAIAEMDTPMRAIGDTMRITFEDGQQMSGKQIKQIWLRCRYVVNDADAGADRGGQTLAELKESQIRFTTVRDYREHSKAALQYIILHEQMHMAPPGVAFWLQAFDDYRDNEGRNDPKGAKYNGDIIDFRRTEQHVNAATREVMRLAGFDPVEQLHLAGPLRFDRFNMPPYGYDLEPVG